jgi:hypothetical protein
LKISALLVSSALLLAACGGPKALELPVDPIDRAATCGIVAAAEARMAVTDVKAPLPLEAQGRILHYALLAASDGGEFKSETANAVSKRMGALQEQVTSGKWRDLGPACAAAFPAAAKAEATLPSGRLDAQLACNQLTDFVATALESQEVTGYGNELAEYRRLASKLNDAIVSGLRAKAGSRLEAQQRVRREALADAAGLGSPVAVIAQCLKKFG